MKQYKMKYGTKTIKCVDFDGLGEQLSYIKPYIENNTYGTPKEVDSGDDFYGTHKLKQTVDGMLYGFKSNTDYLINITAKNKSESENNCGTFMDVEGYAYDMGAFINSEPECCLNQGLPSIVPCIKILIDISFNWTYSSEKLLNRGVAITNLINSLLLKGVMVNLYCFEYNRQYDKDILYTVKIDTQTLPLSIIGFVNTPEYFRQIGFITAEAVRESASEIGRGNSFLTDFMLNKIKKEKIFLIGGSYTTTWRDLDSIDETNKELIEKFNKYTNENKIDLKLEFTGRKEDGNGKN